MMLSNSGNSLVQTIFRSPSTRHSFLRHFQCASAYSLLSTQRFESSNKMPVIYRSLQSIQDVIQEYKLHDKIEIKTMLTKLEDFKLSASKVSKKFPLVVIEGLDGCGKSTTSSQLSRKLGAHLYCTPPTTFHDLRPYFDGSKALRGLFYSLGNYVAAYEMLSILETKPVILDRYWHSTVAYALPYNGDLPPEGDAVYEWPLDLMKPDAVYFLNVDEGNRLKRISSRRYITDQEKQIETDFGFRNNIIRAYKNMRNPDVVFIDANEPQATVIQNLVQLIEPIM